MLPFGMRHSTLRYAAQQRKGRPAKKGQYVGASAAQEGAAWRIRPPTVPAKNASPRTPKYRMQTVRHPYVRGQYRAVENNAV
jgi:hypothetical protein